MSRRFRLAVMASGSILGLMLTLIVAAVFVARSGWLREQVRERIVAEAEKATGGRVDIGSFEFDWRTLTARVNNFVIHGVEPPTSHPLLRVQSITVVLKIVSILKRMVDVQSMDLEQPQACLIIHPDGTTNVPAPKAPRNSNKTPVETILDLAIGRFDVRNGTIEINSERMPWNAAGKNLRAQFVYNLLARSYRGDISIEPLHLKVSKDLPVDMGVKVSLTIEKNKLTVSSARLETAQSNIELSGGLQDFSSPQFSLRYNLRLSLDEAAHTLRFRSRQSGAILIGGGASFRDFGHYLLSGKLSSGALSFGEGPLQLRGVRTESAFRVDPEKIELSGIRLSSPEGNFNGRARIEKLDRFRLEGEASQLDLRRLAAWLTPRRLPWDGLLSGPLEMDGLLSDLYRGWFTGRAQLNISPAPGSAPVHGLIDASYDGKRGAVDLGSSFVQLPSTRLDFGGALGRQLRVHLQSTNLDDLLPALELAASGAPRTLPLKLQNGSAVFEGAVTGSLSSPQIAGHVGLTNFVYSQEKIDSLAADVAIQQSSLRVQNATLARGNLRAEFAGTVGLIAWKPDKAGALSATVTLRGADVHDLLALAGRRSLPAAGDLAATAQVTGTIGTPLIKADVAITRGSFYDEPFDRLTIRVDHVSALVTVANAQINAGGRQLSFSATYAHAPGDFETGDLTAEATSNRMALNQFHLVRQHGPSLAGNAALTAKGSGAVSKARGGQTAFQLTNLSAELTGDNIQIDGKSVGAVRLTASTRDSMLTAHLESGIANSMIRADGQWSLTDDYSGAAQLTFTKLDLASLETWLARPASSFKAAGSVEGKLTISGPALRPEAWTAALEIPRLEITSPPADVTGGNPQTVALRNQGPIRLAMKNSEVRVESAHLAGQATDVTLTGSVSLKEKNPLDLRLKGNIDLAILQVFDSDVISSGTMNADATIRGPLTQPLITGRIELKSANASLSTFPNGLSNANGVILFAGGHASVESLTAESGGGKISATGFASYIGDEAAFRLEVTAHQVRLRYPEGVSTVASAQLTWTGTTQRNLISGTVTIIRTGFNPRTYFGSLLSKSAQPVRTPAAQTGLLGGVNFDIQIATAADVLVQSALAQQIQAEANLRLRGTASNPALLGRINITQGEMTFFGNKYTINQGSISFFNPIKIEPTLNVDLETKARGIDVTLTISGPMNKLNVSYRSDPPMQFSDIVALLATGRTPTSDVSLAARQTGAEQSWQQAGASALVGQAIANPVAGRLQRFFGVSKIKIDPTLTGLDNPQARLTIEQQVTPAITFTYITNVAQANPQVIRIEWSLNRQWSVVALRDENGIFGMDFYYKKRFK
jgi:translocation and assembly module TamB